MRVDEASEKRSTGLMPMDVVGASSEQAVGEGQVQQQQQPSKVETQGKKFGKKLGNAAIFGAGATIGSNIVNGIF